MSGLCHPPRRGYCVDGGWGPQRSSITFECPVDMKSIHHYVRASPLCTSVGTINLPISVSSKTRTAVDIYKQIKARHFIDKIQVMFVMKELQVWFLHVCVLCIGAGWNIISFILIIPGDFHVSRHSPEKW